jgi:hypothetical protein
LPFCDKKGGGIIMHKNKFYKLCLQNIKWFMNQEKILFY